MQPMREFPFCASDHLEVIDVEHEPILLAVQCKECAALGPHSTSPHAEHAIHAWNQRFGRLSLVK